MNNALFLLLFSGIWIARNGDADYWVVAAVFGSVLIALGIPGRRQSTTAGGVNISQGLTIATFAIILKLDGHTLALVLAFESLALATASWKFRGKSEAVFSLLAGLGSTGIVIYDSVNSAILSGTEQPPVWNIALVALFLLAASRMIMRSETSNTILTVFLRAAAAILFTCAAAITTHLCLDRLEAASGLLTASILSLAFSLAVIYFDRKRKQPELAIGSIWFLLLSAFLGADSELTWPLATAAVISLASCWIWHRQAEVEITDSTHRLARLPAISAWLFSLAVPFFVFTVLAEIGSGHLSMLNFHELAALVIAACGIGLRCKRLPVTASGMSLLALLSYLPIQGSAFIPLFLTTLIAIISATTIQLPWSRKNMDHPHRDISSWGFRATAFIAYCAAFQRFAPDTWSDWLALTSIALTLIAFFLKRKLFAESPGLICVALAAFFFATANSPWHLSPEETSWRGITVVLALLSLVLTYRQRPALIADHEKRARAIAWIAGLACAVTTVWATQMLVWRFGWKPSAILWTLLGFGFVSAGLWQRLHILRLSGFLLLIVSFVKLFAADVWDFTAFMRVVSFIVLGAALILLGLFYNKFAGAIKSLLDDERGSGSIRD